MAALASCNPAKDEIIPATKKTTVFVVNEGKFRSSNGTVSIFNSETKGLTLDAFQAANSRSLGDIVQNLAVRENRGYVVVNNSNKVEVVSLPDFKSVATIRGLVSPRYLLPVSATRAYVTQWGNFNTTRAGIKVLDLTTNTVVDSIATGDLPERLLLANGRVFVANYGTNTLTVIDPATNRVTSTVTVGDAPNSLAIDKNNRLWVLCGGAISYDPATNYTTIDTVATTPGSLYNLDPANPAAVATSRTFTSKALSPTDLHLNAAGDQLYFRATDAATYLGGVCRLGIADIKLPSLKAPFIPGLFYGLGIDPSTNLIYTGTGNFSADKLRRYQPAGTFLDETAVGVGVSGFVFY